MRLYLSAFRLGRDPAEFARLVAGRSVGVIMNAADNHPRLRRKALRVQSADLGKLGLDIREIDLRAFFSRPAALAAALSRLDAVWIHGGNAFILRRAMRESGFDRMIRDLLGADRIAYGGFGAAAQVTAPQLRGYDRIDDPSLVPDGYPADPVWEGLDLVPFATVIRLRAKRAKSAPDGTQYFAQNGIPYRTLREGEAFVVDGPPDQVRVAGLAGPTG